MASAEQLQSRRGRWATAAIGGALVWLAAHLLIVAAAIVSRAIHQLPVIPDAGFFALLFGWDSNYYAAIARAGYFAGGSPPGAAAFFPGYPLLSRATADLIPSATAGGSLVFAMWLVAAIASLAAGILVWRLAESRYDRRVAIAATLLVLAGPYALFLAASYAEALFLALAVGGWLFAVRGHWLAAGIVVALASTVRPNGLFLAAAIVVMYLAGQLSSGLRIRVRTVLATCVGFLGAAAYFGYLFAKTGSLATWTSAETHWGRQLEWPWITLYNTVGRILYASTLDRRIQFGLDTVFAAALILAIVYFVRTRAWAEVTYVGLTALSLMTSFTYMSLARSTVTLFPIAIALGATVHNSRRSWMFGVAFGLGLLLLVFNTAQFASGYWAD